MEESGALCSLPRASPSITRMPIISSTGRVWLVEAYKGYGGRNKCWRGSGIGRRNARELRSILNCLDCYSWMSKWSCQLIVRLNQVQGQRIVLSGEKLKLQLTAKWQRLSTRMEDLGNSSTIIAMAACERLPTEKTEGLSISG